MTEPTPPEPEQPPQPKTEPNGATVKPNPYARGL